MNGPRGGKLAAPRSFPGQGAPRIAFVLSLVLVAGAGLRVGPALSWPLRHDEVLTWHFGGPDPSAFLLWSHHPHHPPLGYALVGLSTMLSGTDAEWALRLPSLLAGLACIPLAYLLGRTLGSRTGGILLATLIAFDPLLVDQARQARMYSLYAVLFLGTLVGLAGLGTGSRFSRWRWPVTGLGLAATLWTHVLGLVLWGGVLFGLLTARKEPVRRLAGARAMGMAMALSLPGLAWLWRHLEGTVRSGGPGPDGLGQLLLALRGLDSVYPGKVLALVLLLAALTGLIRLRHRDPLVSRVLVGTFLLSIVAAAVAAGDRAYGIERYLLPLHLSAHVGLVGLAISVGRPRLRGTAWLAIALVAALWIPAVYPGDRARRAHAVGSLTRELAETHVGPGHGVKYVPRILYQQGRFYGLPYERYVTVGRPLPEDYPFDTTWVVVGHGSALPGHSADQPATIHPDLHYVLEPLARHYGRSYDARTLERLVVAHGAVAVAISHRGVRYVFPP